MYLWSGVDDGVPLLLLLALHFASIAAALNDMETELALRKVEYRQHVIANYESVRSRL